MLELVQAAMKQDISNEQDVKILVDSFYDRVNADELLSPIFNDTAHVNWQSHLPIMYSFWSSILLGAKTYRGQPFPKHMPLPIDKNHFDRWLSLFYSTLDEHFSGPMAEHAKSRASTIAAIFQGKLEALRTGLVIAGNVG